MTLLGSNTPMMHASARILVWVKTFVKYTFDVKLVVKDNVSCLWNVGL
ncbi:hypothetical protein HanPSC8_Chr05g0228541 [Helianthus annuus]|nr:hypothetical protein HanPSC8_Chr05g0228541 [Helianthus annuus]